MKIVIDISEKYYKKAKEWIDVDTELGTAFAAIAKGTPLPKGHGDLADKQSIVNQIANTNFWLSADNWSELMEAINDAPTIIKADKES